MIQDIATHIIATIDRDKYLCNDTLNIIYSLKSNYTFEFILCILNSKLVNVWFKKIFPAGLHIKTNQLEQIPIPTIDFVAQQPFVTLANAMLTLNRLLQMRRNRFFHRLMMNFEGIKPNKIMLAFDQFDFKAFVAELKKQKIKLSLTQQDEWEDYFSQYAQACRDLSAKIAVADNEIDQRVYHLYGLTEEEIKIVEGTN